MTDVVTTNQMKLQMWSLYNYKMGILTDALREIVKKL